MKKAPYERILSKIETHCSSAAELLKKSHEFYKSALGSDDLDIYITEINKAGEFQKLSVEEMQKAI